MLSSFEDLTKAYQKALPVIAKEEKGVTPRFYVQVLVEVETFLNELWEDRDGRKNLSKNNSKSLSTLRQKMRKYVKDFETDVAKFKENPGEEEEDEEAEEKSDEESDEEEQYKVHAYPATGENNYLIYTENSCIAFGGG